MSIAEITSIGWLHHTQGIQLVACTPGNPHGFRRIVSREDFDRARHSDESLKQLFVRPA